MATTDEMVRDYIRLHDEAGEDVPPIHMSAADIISLQFEYRDFALAGKVHKAGEYIGTIYGVPLYTTEDVTL